MKFLVLVSWLVVRVHSGKSIYYCIDMELDHISL